MRLLLESTNNQGCEAAGGMESKLKHFAEDRPPTNDFQNGEASRLASCESLRDRHLLVCAAWDRIFYPFNTNLASFRFTLFGFFSSHSQTTKERQPKARRALRFRLSRSAFPKSFVDQNRGRVSGSFERGHFLCACQKQPCTNTAFFLLGITMSGHPGRLFR